MKRKKNRLLISAIVMLLAVAGVLSITAMPEAVHAVEKTFSVTVLDSDSNEPVQGFIAEVWTTRGDNPDEAHRKVKEADSNGTFTVDFSDNDWYLLKVTAEGYENYQSNGVDGWDLNRDNVTLPTEVKLTSTGGSGGNPNVKPDDCRELIVNVKDGETVIDDATITVYKVDYKWSGDPKYQKSETTIDKNANGTWWLPKGSYGEYYTVVVEKSGYKTYDMLEKSGGTEAGTILSENANLSSPETVDVNLEKDAAEPRLTVTVKDKDSGDALDGFTAKLEKSSDGGPWQTFETSTDGKFYGPLPVNYDEYRLVVEKEGYKTYTMEPINYSYWYEDDMPTEFTVELEADVVEPRLTVTVKDKDSGDALDGFTAKLEKSSDGGPWQTFETSTDGKFYGPLPVNYDEYRLVVEKEGYKTYTMEPINYSYWYEDDMPTEFTVELEKEEQVPTFIVTITNVDIATCTVKLQQSTSGGWNDVATLENGKHFGAFDDMEKYRIKVTSEGYKTYEGEEFRGGDRSSEEVTLIEDVPQPVPFAKLTVTVKDEDNNVIKDADIKIFSVAHDKFVDKDEDGTWHLTVGKDYTYKVLVEKEDYKSYESSIDEAIIPMTEDDISKEITLSLTDEKQAAKDLKTAQDAAKVASVKVDEAKKAADEAEKSRKAAEEAAKTPGQAAVDAANKAKADAETAATKAKEAKDAAEAAKAAAEKAVESAKKTGNEEAIESANGLQESAATAVDNAGKAEEAANDMVAEADKVVKKTKEEKASVDKAKADAKKYTPAKVKLAKFKKAKKVKKTTKVTVQWKKVAKNTKGYKIQVKNKKTKKVKTYTVKQGKKKTLKKVVKLKKGKYIVKIRAYNKVGKKTYYGKWSKTRTFKVK